MVTLLPAIFLLAVNVNDAYLVIATVVTSTLLPAIFLLAVNVNGDAATGAAIRVYQVLLRDIAVTLADRAQRHCR